MARSVSLTDLRLDPADDVKLGGDLVASFAASAARSAVAGGLQLRLQAVEGRHGLVQLLLGLGRGRLAG